MGMDLFAITFAAVLLVIGLALVLVVGRGPAHTGEATDDGGRALRQEALRIERQMQRRRWRIWDKIEELHELFTERAAAAEREATLRLPAPTRDEDEGRVYAQGGSDFTIPDIQAAYEVFLREDFLVAPYNSHSNSGSVSYPDANTS